MFLPVIRVLYFAAIIIVVSGCNKNAEDDDRSDDKKNVKLKQSVGADTATINQLNATSYELRRSNPDSAFYLARIAYCLSEQTGYQKGIANAYLNLAYTHLINYSKNDSASIFFRKADSVFKSTGDYYGMGMVAFGMAYVYSFTGDMYKSEEYINECLMLFKKINHKRGLYNAYNSLAYIFQKRKEFGPAYDNIEQAIHVAGELKDTTLIAEGNNNLGNIYKDQYLFNHAIDVYYKALNLWEAKGDVNGISIAYGNIGLMYYYLKDYPKALEYYKKKLPVSIETKNTWEESRTYNDIGFVHLSLNQYDTALFYYQKGLMLNQSMNYPPGITESYHNIATTFLYMNEFDSAYRYVSNSIRMGEHIKAFSGLAGNYVLLGKIQLALKDMPSAMHNLLKGYKLASELGIPSAVAEASEILSREYSHTGHHELAFKYLSRFKQIQDSIKEDENIRNITRLDMQYEFDKKQREIEAMQEQEKLVHTAALKQQRMYLLMAVLFILFLIIAGTLIIRQKNLSLNFKTLDLEQKLLRVQMNPHFIFNSLCAIQDYILNNKKEEANTFLTKFAVLMRSILETSKQDYVTLEKEKEILKNYMDIQKARFETDFAYRFDIDKNIDTETTAIPPMLAQPFVENAIEHGILPMEDKGLIIIRYCLKNGLIRLEVEDNGIGRKKSATINPQIVYKKQSLATSLTLERIKYLQQSENRKTRFEIIDLEDICNTSGTRVVFDIPYRTKNI